jgi:hypothetical protein
MPLISKYVPPVTDNTTTATPERTIRLDGDDTRALTAALTQLGTTAPKKLDLHEVWPRRVSMGVEPIFGHAAAAADRALGLEVDLEKPDRQLWMIVGKDDRVLGFLAEYTNARATTWVVVDASAQRATRVAAMHS